MILWYMALFTPSNSVAKYSCFSGLRFVLCTGMNFKIFSVECYSYLIFIYFLPREWGRGGNETSLCACLLGPGVHRAPQDEPLHKNLRI